MLTLTLAALLGLTFSTPALAGEVVFGVHNEIGIEWNTDETTIFFNLTCNTNNVTDPTAALAWCAFGINTNPSGPSSGMAPAYVWWLAINSAGKALAVEDRVISTIAQPPCTKTQLTTTISSSYNAVTGTLSALFTRPLAAGDAVKGQGFADIINAPLQVIAAVGSKTRPDNSCATNQAEHFFHAGNVAINFLSG